jgi:hypothetical protein
MIYFECYSDQTFLRSLEIPKRITDHSLNKGNVCNKLQRNTNSIGLVDEDPFEAQPLYIRNLLMSKRIVHEDQYVILFFEPKPNNKLILIRPNIERWSIRIAMELGVDLSEPRFALSNDERELHEMLGFSKNHKKLDKFCEFFKLVSKHDSISRIKDFIN